MRLRSFSIGLAFVVASLALGGSLVAADTPTVETTPIPTNAKPDWSSMTFLMGTWHCSSQSSRRPSPYVTTTTTTMDPTGYWMVTKSVSPKVSWAPGTISTDSVTYDPIQHRWADVYTDDQGNYDTTFSPGWKGSTMVWTDALFAPGPDIIWTGPNTVTKVSDTKTTAVNTFKEKSGRTISVNTVCTKG
jgi:hypothetical protein